MKVEEVRVGWQQGLTDGERVVFRGLVHWLTEPAKALIACPHLHPDKEAAFACVREALRDWEIVSEDADAWQVE